MMKVGWIFQVAEHRDPVDGFSAIVCHRGPKPRCTQRANAKTEHVPAG